MLVRIQPWYQGWLLPPCLRPHSKSSLELLSLPLANPCHSLPQPTPLGSSSHSLPTQPSSGSNSKQCLAYNMHYRNDWQIAFCISIAINLHGVSKRHRGWSDKPRFQLPSQYLEAAWLRTNYSFSLNLFPHLGNGMAKPSSYTVVRTKWENLYHVLNVSLTVCFLLTSNAI